MMSSRLLALALAACAFTLIPSALIARGETNIGANAAPQPVVAPAAGAIAGPGNELAVAADPALVGQWGAPFTWPEVAVHMMLLDTGKVLTWQQGSGQTFTDIWNPATGTFTSALDATTNLFCAGHAPLADGRMLAIGGDFGSYGVRDVASLDPQTELWTARGQMAFQRWYPTGTLLPDGRMLTTSGAQGCRACVALIPEVYDATTDAWTQLTAASANIPLYPFMFVLPDGRVLHAGGSEVATSTEILDIGAQTWTSLDSRIIDGGSAAMYAPGKVIKSGSASDDGAAGQSLATTYLLDTGAPSPAWRQTAAMNSARSFLNLTLLPDDSVLATGGDTTKSGLNPATAVYAAESWSSTTETWTPLASMTTPRLYHSTALLLPDGRVLSAGSGAATGAPYQTNAELYSPPYLFKGARPTITASPAAPIPYGSSFFVGTPDGASIAAVSLIRTGSVTHAFDQNARRMPLAFTQTAGGLNITAPANANLAPPGDYMLFIVNSNGVPSVAPFVRLPVPPADAQPPSAPPNLVASGGAGSASLMWDAATDNIGVTGYNVHRGTAPGFAPTTANRIAQPSTPGYVDLSAPAGTSYYRVTAQDAAGNVSVPSNEASAIVTSPPTATATATNTSVATATNTPGGAATNTPTSTSSPTPTNTPSGSGTLAFGRTATTGVDDSSDDGYLNGSPATLGTAGTLASLSVYVGSTPAGAHVRLGLYTNGGGSPGALLAQSADTIATAGWNTLPMPPGTALAAGSYWILGQADKRGTVFRYSTGLAATDYVGWTPLAYGAFPASVSSFHQQPGEAFSMYGTVYTSTPPTSTPTSTSTVAQTITSTPTQTNTPTPTATNTSVPTATNTSTPTATNTAAPTPTNTAVATPTNTRTPAATNTAIATSTNTPTPTNTPITISTNTPTPSATNTSVPTSTNTRTPTPTNTAAPTSTKTPTATATNSATPTSTRTPTPTVTNTAVPTSTNTPTGGTTILFGRTATAGLDDSSDDGYLNGSPATLASAATLSSLSVYIGATTPGANVRLALYASDAGGTPTTLLAQTAEGAAVAGWTTLPVISPVSLAAGTYWILALTDNSAVVYRYATGLPSTSFYGWAPQTYGPFPAAIATWHRAPTYGFSMYGTAIGP